MHPSVLYELSLELDSVEMACEKVTELLFQSIYSVTEMADNGTELSFHGNTLENAGRV